MAMMIMPLPHIMIICRKFFEVRKKNVSGVPPPPAERLFQGWHKSFGLAQQFAPPPPSKHLGAAPDRECDVKWSEICPILYS